MIRCLLVTGDKAVRDSVKVGLEQTQAYEVDVVENNWALDAAKNNEYAAVVCECQLSDGRDGLELLSDIRGLLPDASFLLISRTRTQSRYLSREKQTLGINGFIQIPIEPAEFFRSVIRLAEKIQAEAA